MPSVRWTGNGVVDGNPVSGTLIREPVMNLDEFVSIQVQLQNSCSDEGERDALDPQIVKALLDQLVQLGVILRHEIRP